ncbi:MAG: helix-hairpin-helix domain-containing protein [Nanoarchaeota archaeon]
MLSKQRKLTDLVSVGPAMERDFHLLGIKTVEQLKSKNAVTLYRALCAKKGKVDICCQDVFQAAIMQAKYPNLTREKRNWWFWSQKRKQTLNRVK